MKFKVHLGSYIPKVDIMGYKVHLDPIYRKWISWDPEIQLFRSELKKCTKDTNKNVCIFCFKQKCLYLLLHKIQTRMFTVVLVIGVYPPKPSRTYAWIAVDSQIRLLFRNENEPSNASQCSMDNFKYDCCHLKKSEQNWLSSEVGHCNT